MTSIGITVLVVCFAYAWVHAEIARRARRRHNAHVSPWWLDKHANADPFLEDRRR